MAITAPHPAQHQRGQHPPLPVRVGPGRVGPVRVASRRTVTIVVVAPLLVLGIVLGTVAAWGALTAPDQPWSSTVSTGAGADRAHLPGGASSLFESTAAGVVVVEFGEAVAGTSTRFTQLSFYADEAFATVQDAADPSQLHRYVWRAGQVALAEEPTADTVEADLDALAFAASDVDFSTIARLVAEAPTRTEVEQGSVSNVVVDRSTFSSALPITIRIYVTGPRSSGFVEASATGDIIAVH